MGLSYSHARREDGPMKLVDLQLESPIVTISHLVLNSGGRRQELLDVTAVLTAGFIYVERFINGQVVVNAYPAAVVEEAENVSAVSSPG